jgi:hypothetical protein
MRLCSLLGDLRPLLFVIDALADAMQGGDEDTPEPKGLQ